MSSILIHSANVAKVSWFTAYINITVFLVQLIVQSVVIFDISNSQRTIHLIQNPTLPSTTHHILSLPIPPQHIAGRDWLASFRVWSSRKPFNFHLFYSFQSSICWQKLFFYASFPYLVWRSGEKRTHGGVVAANDDNILNLNKNHPRASTRFFFVYLKNFYIFFSDCSPTLV